MRKNNRSLNRDKNVFSEYKTNIHIERVTKTGLRNPSQYLEELFRKTNTNYFLKIILQRIKA